MKNSVFAIAIFFFWMSCQKEDNFPDGYDHPCDYMLGRFEYLPSSLERMAYEGRNTVVFVDTFGNELEFSIVKSFTDDKQAIVRAWPDMTRMYFCYESQPVEYKLNNDSLGMTFYARLMARVDSFDPLEKLIADEVTVLQYQNPDSIASLSVFKKIIDQRSFPEGDYNSHLDLYTCFGRTFMNVEHDPIPAFEPYIFYNDTEGVVSFHDSSDKKWCFDRFE